MRAYCRNASLNFEYGRAAHLPEVAGFADVARVELSVRVLAPSRQLVVTHLVVALLAKPFRVVLSVGMLATRNLLAAARFSVLSHFVGSFLLMGFAPYYPVALQSSKHGARLFAWCTSPY